MSRVDISIPSLPESPKAPETPPDLATPVSEPQTNAKVIRSPEIPTSAIPKRESPLALDSDPRGKNANLLITLEDQEETKAENSANLSPANSPNHQLPKLRKILTAVQRKALDRAIETNIQAAQEVLSTIGSRSLTSNQTIAVRRIQGFLKQAEETRDIDPTIAKNLANQARLLAQDLVQFLK